VHTAGSLPTDIVGQVQHQAGPLNGPWPAIIVGAVAVAAVVIGVGLLVRGRHARRLGRPPHRPGQLRLVVLRLTTMSYGVLSLLLVAATVGLGVNAYAGYFPTVGSVVDWATGSAAAPSGPAGPNGAADPVAAAPGATGAEDGVGGPPDIPAGQSRNPKVGVDDSHPELGPQFGSRPEHGSRMLSGRVATVPIGAPALHVPTATTYVYLPPGYDDPANASTRYPVLELIHGHPGRSADWILSGGAASTADLLIQRGLIRPMILVMPDANGGWSHDSECLDAVNGPQLEQYLSTTVPAAIDAAFRTVPDRAHRAIGGMSSGAFCALNLGLKHQDRFATIIASEPYSNPGAAVLAPLLHGDRAAFAANSPEGYLPTMIFTAPMAVMLDAGTDDRGTRPVAERTAEQLAARGQYVALRLAPRGGHTWWTARMELPYGLIFAAEQFR
jgi:enterochelin esterase-like enzyme